MGEQSTAAKRAASSQAVPVSLEQILITPRLYASPSGPPNLQEEGKALRVLARMLATEPHKLIDGLLGIAIQLCGAGTAGLSVLETLSNGEQIFRWTHLAGRLKRFVDSSTPRHFSPCGACLDRDSPQLFLYPARRFQYLADAIDVPIVEALVIPVPLGLGAPATIWILSHEEGKGFDAEDVRIMTELADFTRCALGLTESLASEQKARKDAEREILQRQQTERELKVTQGYLEKGLEAEFEARRQGEVEIASQRQAAGKLRESQAKLESVVEARTAQLRQLSARLQTSQDEERRRIARDLHDSVGQYLSGIQMQLDAYIRENSVTSMYRITDVKELVERSLSEIRTISHLLHPPLLDEIGLVSALSWYATGFADRSGIRVELDIPEHLDRLPSEIETAIFRVIQQALANIHRHAGSKVARIIMKADAEQVFVEICDEGQGIAANILEGLTSGTQLRGVGIAGMRERITNMGGAFRIKSNENGTTIEINLPLPQEG